MYNPQILLLFARKIDAVHECSRAYNAVDRGANFVAHVGHELALGTTGSLGSLFGTLQPHVDLTKFLRALVDHLSKSVKTLSGLLC